MNVQFYAAEISVYTPGAASVTVAEGHGTTPNGTVAQLPDVMPKDTVLYASDAGYRTRAADPQGVTVYPPYMTQAFAINVALNLDPGNSAVAASWGTIELSNLAGTYSAIAQTWNSDGRDVRILMGTKPLDPARGIVVDPPYAALAPAFVGFATPWALTAASLSIPLKDATYWLERPFQPALYTGAGGYSGGANLAGTPLPRTRGGTSANPVRNVTPVLVDAVNRIYQYNDGPGTVAALYEGGYQGYPCDGDVSNLYVGAPAAGHYRTCNGAGMFQLGNAPQGQVTVDVTGQFPSAGAVTTIARLIQHVMLEDMSLPARYLNLPSFDSADARFPYTGGVYYDPSSKIDGIAAVDALLAGIQAKLTVRRDGTLQLLPLRALTGAEAITAYFTTGNATTVTPVALPTTLDPPPYRWRVSYSHNYTVQTSGILPAADPAQSAFAGVADQYASYSSDYILQAYRRPNDPAAVVGGLLVRSDAQALANDLGALWCVQRGLYDVVVPVAVGLACNIGDVVAIVWPIPGFESGYVGQIVGEQFRSGDASITFRVLMNGDTVGSFSAADFTGGDFYVAA